MTKSCILFDLDDTLHDFTGAARPAEQNVLALLATGSGIPRAELERNYRRVLERHAALAFADGRSSRDYRAERFRGALGGEAARNEKHAPLVERALAEYEKHFIAALKLKPGAKEILAELRARGVSLAIATDAPEDAQARVIERLEIREYFSAVFTSGRMGLCKKRGMLPRVLAQLGAAPAYTTMIGNSPESDIEPALAAGMKAVWFNDAKAPNPCGYLSVATHAELPRILQF